MELMRGMSLTKKTLFYGTAFTAGFITLSLELLGFRVLAPYFGYSIYVFGSLIGLILLALAIGYILGGLFGGNVQERQFSFIMLGGGIYITLSAAYYPNLLALLQNMSVIPGALLGTLLLYAVPMVIFAAVSPYLIGRLADFHEAAGRSAGIISGFGTIGSLTGTFLTSFVLLPDLGARTTFFINALISIGLAVIWLATLETKKALIVFLVPTVLFMTPPSRSPAVVQAVESPYAHLEVVNYGDSIALRAEHRSGSAYSIMPLSGHWNNWSTLYTLFAVPPLLTSGNEALLLGLGAGTLPLVHEELNPGLRITGVEIDPEVVALGKQYFNLNVRKNIDRIVIEDVRPFLIKDTRLYDVVDIDLFKGGTEIPFYLATREFFMLTSQHLKDQGVLAMNVYDPEPRQTVLDSILATLESIYPYVYEVPAGRGSFFVIAAKQDIEKQLAEADKKPAPGLQASVAYVISHITRVEHSAGLVLTDDKAPLEQMYSSVQ